MVYDDADLVRRTLEGEQDAFEALVRKYQDAIYGFAFHLIGDFAEAQDVTQQAFVIAYMKLPQLKDAGKFVPWIKRIAANECALWVRQRRQTSRLHEKVGNPDYPVSTPHEEYEEKEIEAIVRKAMEALSEKNRLAMTLYYIDGLSQREVGSFLGISTSAVENRIARARKQLREEMMSMVGDMFEGNKLPDDFTQKVRKTLDKAKEAEGKKEYIEALTYSDEALDILSNVPEGSEVRELKTEALWLKGNAAQHSTGPEERMKYHEQALELVEKSGDRRTYADALLHVAGHASSHARKEKSIRYKQKALKIYEEMGDLVKQADVWMWLGGDYFFTNEQPKEAIAHFQKALALYGQAQDDTIGDESVCRSAIRAIKEIGGLPCGGKLLSCGATSPALRKTPEKIIPRSQPGIFRFVKRIARGHKGDRDDALHTMIFPSLRNGRALFDYEIEVGNTSVMESQSYTSKPTKATRTVESDSETVNVVAGKFTDCLKIRTVVTPSPDDNGLEQDRIFNRTYYCGIKQAWFAPGVGPVKLIFNRADGITAHIELTEYSVEDVGDDYFPLSVGNKWTYRWIGLDERYISKDYYEVAVQKGNIYYLDHHAYSYFSGSEEEYQALRAELITHSPALDVG
ncbi:sigma-70 family RNA polymerase sigma factor [Candidatus Poribacteria bacterium]